MTTRKRLFNRQDRIRIFQISGVALLTLALLNTLFLKNIHYPVNLALAAAGLAEWIFSFQLWTGRSKQARPEHIPSAQRRTAVMPSPISPRPYTPFPALQSGTFIRHP